MPDPLRPSDSASGGAERIIVVAGCAIRLGTLVQMLPSAKQAVELSDRPSLAAATWAVAAAAVLGFVARALTRRGPIRPWEVVLDGAVAVALLVAGAWTVPAEVRIGTWVGFQPGYALSVVVSLAACRTRWLFAGLLLAVLIGKVAYVWSAVTRSSITTVLGDFLTVVVIAVISAAVTSYLRRLAAEADVARGLAALEEQRRASTVFHNGVAMVGMLADPDLDPAVRSVVARQAREEIHRLRSYLRGDLTRPDDGALGSVALADLLTAAAQRFPDVAPHVMADLAIGARVDGEVADALSSALTSLLLNVRQHARASTTVLHAEDLDGAWTVTVHDDGVGFDRAHVRLGVGLEQVVTGALRAHGVDVAVDSLPGLGTTVTLTGRSLR